MEDSLSCPEPDQRSSKKVFQPAEIIINFTLENTYQLFHEPFRKEGAKVVIKAFF